MRVGGALRTLAKRPMPRTGPAATAEPAVAGSGPAVAYRPNNDRGGR